MHFVCLVAIIVLYDYRKVAGHDLVTSIRKVCTEETVCRFDLSWRV